MGNTLPQKMGNKSPKYKLDDASPSTQRPRVRLVYDPTILDQVKNNIELQAIDARDACVEVLKDFDFDLFKRMNIYFLKHGECVLCILCKDQTNLNRFFEIKNM